MVVIRLARGGSKKNPFYHIVAADKRSPRDGRYLENMGYFNPVARGLATRLEVKQDRVDHWVSQGAQVSDRVHRLLKEFAAGMTGPKAHKPKKKANKAKAEAAPADAEPAAEAPADAEPAAEAAADNADA